MGYTAPVPGFGKLEGQQARDFIGGDGGGPGQADMAPQQQPKRMPPRLAKKGTKKQARAFGRK
ncbi:MAG TPA: hypothetical protein VE964_08820 [Myxococcales bacterium]|nr:hypothetical protein [Myxococcales bacterium]